MAVHLLQMTNSMSDACLAGMYARCHIACLTLACAWLVMYTCMFQSSCSTVRHAAGRKSAYVLTVSHRLLNTRTNPPL